MTKNPANWGFWEELFCNAVGNGNGYVMNKLYSTYKYDSTFITKRRLMIQYSEGIFYTKESKKKYFKWMIDFIDKNNLK